MTFQPTHYGLYFTAEHIRTAQANQRLQPIQSAADALASSAALIEPATTAALRQSLCYRFFDNVMLGEKAWKRVQSWIEAPNLAESFFDQTGDLLTIARHRRDIGVEAGKLCLHLRIAQTRRGEHGQVVRIGKRGHGRWRHRFAATRTTRRLAIHGYDVMPRRVQSAQRRNREIGRPHEDDAHVNRKRQIASGGKGAPRAFGPQPPEAL